MPAGGLAAQSVNVQGDWRPSGNPLLFPLQRVIRLSPFRHGDRHRRRRRSQSPGLHAPVSARDCRVPSAPRNALGGRDEPPWI